MHYWHALLVRAETPDDAELEAGKFLEKHKEKVWEYYNVGGKWTGIHADDVVPIKGNEEQARSTIDTQLTAQATSLQQLKTKLAENALDVGSLVTPQESYRSTGAPTKLNWAGEVLQLIGKLVGGDYCIESWFWDVERDSPHMTDARWAEITGEGDRYWLVSVDLHP